MADTVSSNQQLNSQKEPSNLSAKASAQTGINRSVQQEKQAFARVAQAAASALGERRQEVSKVESAPKISTTGVVNSIQKSKPDAVAPRKKGDPTVLISVQDSFKNRSIYRSPITATQVELSSDSKFGGKSFRFQGDQGSTNKLEISIPQKSKTPKYSLPINDKAFTVDAWIKYERYPSRLGNDLFWPTFLQFPTGPNQGGGGYTLDIFNDYVSFWRTGQPETVNTQPGYPSGDLWILHQTKITPGQWNHIGAMAKDNKLHLYVNGEPTYEPISASFSISGESPFTWGNWTVLPDYEYKGNIDAIRIRAGARFDPAGFTPPNSPGRR